MITLVKGSLVKIVERQQDMGASKPLHTHVKPSGRKSETGEKSYQSVQRKGDGNLSERRKKGVVGG